MEIFDVHRRDIHSFDSWMDLKKPGFGGHESSIKLKDSKGKDVVEDRKLKGYQGTVKRHGAFSHPVYDPTYKAMGGDLVHHQEVGQNPYEYDESTGIPVVDVKEGYCYTDFGSFVFESAVDAENGKCSCDGDCSEDCSCDCDGCKSKK